MEFIVAEHIKALPMALVHPEKIDDPAVRAEIARLTQGYERPADFFVRQLAEGVGTIAAAFYPKPVIVRMSDFKTNEYASLLGGRWFEPKEENPMIGFRGASRYTHPAYAEGFALECAAMKRVREAMGLVNVKLMIPFCRHVPEAERVLQAMAGHGLERGVNGLEIYVMCEIPNNVIQIDAFARLFDGFSIGSNDLSWAPVLESKRTIVGAISAADLLQFHTQGQDPTAVRAWQRCSYKPIIVSPDTPVSEVARLMIESNIHHVVVIDSGGIAGVVSSLDFVRTFLRD